MSRKHPTKAAKAQSIFIKASAANTGGPNYPAASALPINPMPAKSLSIKSLPRKKIQRSVATLNEGSPRGYGLAVKVGQDASSGEWQFVTLEYGNRLSTTTVPYALFPEVNNDLAEFWRMVTLDRAYNFDEKYIHIETMKLVEVFVGVKDVSEKLFIDADAHRDNQKLAALAKLSPQEATLLGLETEYVMLMMMKNKPDENRAQALLRKLNETLVPLEPANK